MPRGTDTTAPMNEDVRVVGYGYEFRTERQCALQMGLDVSTLRDYRINGDVKPVATGTVSFYEPLALIEQLQANARSERVRELAKKWGEKLRREEGKEGMHSFFSSDGVNQEGTNNEQ